MMQRQDPFEKFIDWNVHYAQQGSKSAPAPEMGEHPYQEPEDYDINNPKQKPTVQTFLGEMPRVNHREQLNDPEYQKKLAMALEMGAGGGINMIGRAGSQALKGPVMEVLGKAKEKAEPYVEKVKDYLQPSKEAERFRATLGEGTSRQNIEELGKRAQLAKGSTKQEALIPKEQLYAREGKSDVYNIGEASLPEGNLERIAHIVEPGAKFGEEQSKAISNALKNYRKGGDTEGFIERMEDLFKIESLPPKAAAQLEDALSLPTKRDSRYFSSPEVTSVYSPKGELMQLHSAYEAKPTLNNYDALQSALKKELRSMEGRAKVSDTAQPKVDQLKANIEALNKDKEAFMKTLPADMQDLENVFRRKYAKYAETYEKGKAETGASLTLRRLAEGRTDKVTDNAIVKLFAHPTKADKQALLDMGEGAARNAVYAALQKVPQGEAKQMAETILDLKRTKGFDQIITPEMEAWAHGMVKQTSRVEYIKNALSLGGFGAAGLALGGPAGAVIGAFTPKAIKGIKAIMSKKHK